MSRFLFYMGHPAHYHNFKNVSARLREEGHQVLFVARGKDVLFDLLEGEPTETVRLQARKPSGKIGLAVNLARRELKLLQIARKWKPDLMAGTDPGITHVGKLLGIPAVVVNEDDSAAVPMMAKTAFPFATTILAPQCCDQSPYNHKKTAYRGYQELTYLHPDVFTPDRSLLPAAMRDAETYFILRFASLHAHHDEGRKGIDDDLAKQLIEILLPHGKVFITSERTLQADLEPHRLPIHPKFIHHALAYARLTIGDSQTMTAESAVLGVHAVRFNDFVGELSYLEELEDEFGLTTGVRTNRPDQLLDTVKNLVRDEGLGAKMQSRRREMLAASDPVLDVWVDTFKRLAPRNHAIADTHREM